MGQNWNCLIILTCLFWGYDYTIVFFTKTGLLESLIDHNGNIYSPSSRIRWARGIILDGSRKGGTIMQGEAKRVLVGAKKLVTSRLYAVKARNTNYKIVINGVISYKSINGLISLNYTWYIKGHNCWGYNYHLLKSFFQATHSEKLGALPGALASWDAANVWSW